MKWSDIQIIDKNDKVHTGVNAKKFVAQNCQPLAIRTTKDDVIEVNRNLSTDNREVRAFLLKNLIGKAKVLRFLTRKDAQRIFLPVARADLNVADSISATLKVEIVYYGVGEDLTPQKYFVEDSIVEVKALREGAPEPLKMETKKGVADFGKVLPGQYTITADYSRLEKCKYDWLREKTVAFLKSAEHKTVELQVEPLYQKVQLIGHCMLAIPDFTYVFSENDLKKVKIDKDFNWNNLSFNQKPDSERTYTAKDCGEQVEAVIADDEKEAGYGRLTMNAKDTSKYFELSEIKLLLDPAKVEVKEPFGNSPNKHLVEFKEKHPGVPIYPLELKTKKNGTPYTSDDIKEYLGTDQVKNTEPVFDSGSTPEYKVKFKTGYNAENLKKTLPPTIAEFGEKVKPPDINAYPLELKMKEDSKTYYEFKDIDEYVYTDPLVRSVDLVDEKDPPRYKVVFKNAESTPENLAKKLPPTIGVFGEREKPPDINAYILTPKKKDDDKTYYALKDIKEHLDNDLIESIESNSVAGSYKYNVEFKEDIKPKELKKPLPSDIGVFGEKELYQPADLNLSKDKGQLFAKSSDNAYTAKTLELLVKDGDEHWRLDELDAYLKNESVLEIYHEESEPNPHKFIIKFKENCSEATLEPPLPDEIGAFGTKGIYPDLLEISKKKDPTVYWTLEELDWPEVKNLVEMTGVYKDPIGQKDIKHMPTFTYKDKVSKDFANKKKLEEEIKKKDPQNKKVKVAGSGATLRFLLQEKPPSPEYYKLNELKDTLLQKIETPEEKNKLSDDPPVYKIKFKSGSAQYTQDDLEGKWMGKYHGLYHDRDDMNARLKLVEATLKIAYSQAEKDPTILKVFMLPECYFQGRYGAYRVEGASLLLKGLLNLVGDTKWRDWMFVFGTVNLTFGDEIREMMNYSPVVRGGLGPASEASGGGGENDTHLRLIQKLINSAELLDQSQLLHHLKPGDIKDKDLKEEIFYEVRPDSETSLQQVTGINKENYEEVRTPSVNDAVQFQATQNEEEVGWILQKLLDKGVDFEDLKSEDFKDGKFGVAHGLKPEQWTELKAELEQNVSKLGLTRVVRYIRNCVITGRPDKLEDWGLYSGYVDQTKAHLKPDTYLDATSEKLLIKLIKNAYTGHFVRNPLTEENTPPTINLGWTQEKMPGRTGTAKKMRDDILDYINKNFEELIKPFGITLKYQKEKLLTEIKKLTATDEAAIEFVLARTCPTQAQQLGDDVLITFNYIKADEVESKDEDLPDEDAKEDEVKSKESNYVPVKKNDIKDIKTRISKLLSGEKSVEFIVTGTDEVRNNVKSELGDDMKHIPVIVVNKDPDLPETFGASIYPIWKKILELFMKTNPSVMTFDSETMNFRDYCFAGRRKAGPWVPLAEVADLDPCKKMVFGLEICADHGSGERLKKALSQRKPIPMLSLDDEERFTKVEIEIARRAKENDAIVIENDALIEKAAREKVKEEIKKENARRAKENDAIVIENVARAKVKIDIQLVPSAGFYPTDNSIAARKGGYCFNCDGWNKGANKGVNYINLMFNGPTGTPLHETVHPVKPHTAIAKGGDKVKRNMPLFKPARIKLSTEPDTKDLGEGILNRSGLGELHVYKPLDLPKD